VLQTVPHEPLKYSTKPALFVEGTPSSSTNLIAPNLGWAGASKSIFEHSIIKSSPWLHPTAILLKQSKKFASWPSHYIPIKWIGLGSAPQWSSPP
jgi:hypothetical protein